MTSKAGVKLSEQSPCGAAGGVRCDHGYNSLRSIVTSGDSVFRRFFRRQGDVVLLTKYIIRGGVVIMNLKPVIKSQLKKFIQKFSLEEKSEEEAFEYFVNYNILHEHDYRAFQGSTELLSFVSVGQSNDMGIDGIAIKINGALLEQAEHLDDLLQSRRINVEFIFIQSKFQLRFDIGSYQKFLTGVAAFLSDKQLQPTNNKIKTFLELKKEYYLTSV